LGMAPLALAWENSVGERQVIGRPRAGIVPEIDNGANTVTWEDCFGAGLSFQYNLRPDHFFKTVTIRSKADLPAPTIALGGLKLTVVMGLSWGNVKLDTFAVGHEIDEIAAGDVSAGEPEESIDNPGERAYRRLTDLQEAFWLQRPKAWDSYAPEVPSPTDAAPHSINVDWRLERRGNRVLALFSVPAAALNSPQVVYPVYVDTAIGEEQVGSSLDDGFTVNGSYGDDQRTASDVYLNIADAASVYSLFRFVDVPIPQGVTITSAVPVGYSRFIVDRPNVYIHCELIDDSPNLDDAHPVIDDRTRTTAFVEWTDVD